MGELTTLVKLSAIARVASQAGAISIAKDALELSERLSAGRFFVACLGQFKRGKSTLINALLEQDILPRGVAPVTSVVTVLRYGVPRARVRLAADAWREIQLAELRDYVAEAYNPQNRKGVTGVEVYCPSALLEPGLCLVDTPGISSVFSGNTQETHDFVPQIDAAIVVLGGDPPISADELMLLETVRQRVADVLLVLNKVDRISEQECEEARAFTESIVAQRMPGFHAPLYEVSALERFEQRGAERQWPQLIAHLRGLAELTSPAIVERASERGVEALAARLHRQLSEQRDALTRPAAESERRLQELRRCAQEAELAWVEVSHLFDAEQQRFALRFGRERAELLKASALELERQLDATLDALAKGTSKSKVRERACDQARELAEHMFGTWMAAQKPRAEAEFVAATERFVGHANTFLERTRASSELAAGALPAALVPEAGLRARSRFVFASLMRFSSQSIATRIADSFRREELVRQAAKRRACALGRQLLTVNTQRFFRDVDDRVLESRRGVESALKRTLQEIAGTAEQAALRAEEVRVQGERALKNALQEVDRGLHELALLDAVPAGNLRPVRRSHHS